MIVAALLTPPDAAAAAQSCGLSNNRTICFVDVPSTLTGEQTIHVTVNPSRDRVFYQWVPDAGSPVNLMEDFAPNPLTGDYSFVWPTEKFLDGLGTLEARSGSRAAAPVSIRVTLSNGNLTDIQHSPPDWPNYMPPQSWPGASDPVLAAVGDGASGKVVPESVVASIQAQNPALFLYLGDVYEDGTPTEYVNHYGQPNIAGATGTTWGKFWTITQSVIGNHEFRLASTWDDYWHQHPEWYSFTFANTLFFGLSSSDAIKVGSAQYNYVKSVLTSISNPPPPCIVAFWHIPALLNSTLNPNTITNKKDVWKLLADHGGDVVLNGHVHTMIDYLPPNDTLQLPTGGEPTMVQLVDGAGGPPTSVGGAPPDPRIEWTVAKTPGGLFMTLDGAVNGGTPASISWSYRDTNGTVLHTGTRTC